MGRGERVVAGGGGTRREASRDGGGGDGGGFFGLRIGSDLERRREAIGIVRL